MQQRIVYSGILRPTKYDIRDERKKQKGLSKFINSFKYPISGLKYAYRNEQNLAVDVGVALIVCILAFVFKVSAHEWALLALTIGLVLSMELVKKKNILDKNCILYETCSIELELIW